MQKDTKEHFINHLIKDSQRNGIGTVTVGMEGMGGNATLGMDGTFGTTTEGMGGNVTCGTVIVGTPIQMGK